MIYDSTLKANYSTNYHAREDEQDYRYNEPQEQIEIQKQKEEKDDSFIEISRGIKAITLCEEHDL